MSTNTPIYTEDELEPPQWLNADFLNEVLRQAEGDAGIQVRKYEITPGTLKGDHFASIMFRARVNYEKLGKEKRQFLLVKAMPEVDGQKKDMVQDSEVFETEIVVYSEAVPEMERILRTVGDETAFGPRCLYSTLTPRKVMVFEDLVPLGYEVIRDREANMDEVKAALLKLAKWHATSHKMLSENSEVLNKCRNDFMALPNMIEYGFVTGGIELFIEMLDTQPDLQQYKQYFQALQPKLIDNCVRMFREYREAPQLGGIYALCHGDFHIKNMMFKHEEEQLRDVLLLDFQMAHVGPVISDLMFSIYLLMDAEMRAKHLDTLLRFYHAHFVETLEQIRFEGRVPQFDDLEAERKRHRSWEFFLLVSFLPMMYDLLLGEADVGQYFDSIEYRRRAYNHPAYVSEVHSILPRYQRLGFLERL